MVSATPAALGGRGGWAHAPRRGVDAGSPGGGSLTLLGRVSQGAIALLVLALVAAVAVTPLFPRRVAPATAPAEAFSAERAMVHLPAVAAQPHPIGSAAQARVRDYLLRELAALGLQAEVQRTVGVAPPGRPRVSAPVENVVARLRGTAPSGAVLILTHYDSAPESPGAADNGSGVAALLEAMRALAAGPAPRNDVIALFDDGEELSFLGANAFVTEHPWMADVRVAIGLDTAVRGPIMVNETGPRNGWLVRQLSRAWSGGAWSSASGGGTYEYYPFRLAGIQGMELEDNYPFREQHTPLDRLGIVSAASVQQLGEQTLAIVRELGVQDLSQPWGEAETFFSVPLVGLVHYPQAWTGPLVAAAGVLLAAATGMARRRGLVTWRGQGVALASLLVTAVAGGAAVGIVWSRVPALAGWNTADWPEWPEVVPPNGALYFAGFGLLVLVLTVAAYRFARRRGGVADVALAGLWLYLALAVLFAIGRPGAAFLPLWVVAIGALAWVVAGTVGEGGASWSVHAAALVAAVGATVLVLPFFPISLMSDGLKSVAILSGVWALLLGVLLPAVDGLLVQKR